MISVLRQKSANGILINNVLFDTPIDKTEIKYIEGRHSDFSIWVAVQKLGTYDRRVLSWMAKEFLGKGNSSVVDNFGEQSLSYLAQAYDKLVEILGDTPVNYSVIEGGQNE